MDKKLLDSLKLALSNEIVGEEFYMKTSSEAKDDFTRNTFTHLAKDEVFHIQRIKEFIKTEKADEIEAKIRNRNPKSGLLFFQMTEEEFNKRKESFKGDFAHYNFAIELEVRAANLYEALFNSAKDQKTKDFFEFLIKEEKTHKKILEEALSFLKDPADYFLETERWTFD
jgi:rubrerythrin